jgi:hypothetical protein
LAQAERHAADGRRHIERQRRVVVQLVRTGQDSESSRHLLRLFEELQAMHVSDRDRLREQLGLPVGTLNTHQGASSLRPALMNPLSRDSH